MLSKIIVTRLRLALFVIVCVGMFSCAPPPKVAVVERVTIDRDIEIDRMGGNLIRHIAPGETLYSIAFEMGLDVNEVAAWNGVTDTTKLAVGKRIRLTKPINFVAATKPVVTEPADRKVAVEDTEKPATDKKPSVRVVKQSTAPIEKIEESTQPESQVSTLAPAAKALVTWSWPLNGKVVRSFSQAQGHQGIDIQGDVGQAVLSTNAGEVVYVGNSLKGYGNLVIIKHNEDFLSAYAHNSEIYVREGEHINSRQRIASVGLNRNKQTALHFQIRKNGQPVNPLSYLAKKG